MKAVLTIANWNVQRISPSQARATRIRDYCEAVDADIWILTEAHEDFAPKEGYFSVVSGTPDRVSNPGEKWSAIWSKWPIEILDDYVTHASRCVAWRITGSPFGHIIIYATVLPWKTDSRAKQSSSFQAFADAVNVQKFDWLNIQRDFPRAALILAGDFNQGLAPWHYYGSKRKRAVLEGALVESNLIALTAMGDDPIARDSDPMACIDHICISASGDWELESTMRWPETQRPLAPLSDHFGVRIQLSFEGKESGNKTSKTTNGVSFD